MKKIFALILLMLFSMTVHASDLCAIKYKNIPNKSKISYNVQTNEWSAKVNKNNDLYFIKTKGFGDCFDYLDSNKEYAFSTDCEYEFISNGKFIGYSNSDFMFYEFSYIDGRIVKTPISYDTLSEVFSEYKIIKLSEFSPETNSLKIKKGIGDLKIIIFNDKNLNLSGFNFSTGNSEIEEYQLKGFLNIKKKGMIQFAKDGASMKDSNWFILLVR